MRPRRRRTTIGNEHVRIDRRPSPRGLPELEFATATYISRADTALEAHSGIAQGPVNPYYQRWSFTIQRELPAGWLLDLGYVGSKGTKLFATEQLNPLVPGPPGDVPASVPANRKQGRLDPLQGPGPDRTNGASSTYNSFQTEVKRRFANGFQFNSSYTWSKSIDNVSELFNFGNTASRTLSPSRASSAEQRSTGPFLLSTARTAGYSITLRASMDEGEAQRSELHRRRMASVGPDGLRIGESLSDPATARIPMAWRGSTVQTSTRSGSRVFARCRTRRRRPDTSILKCRGPAGNPTPINPADARFIGLPANPNPNSVGTIGNLGRNTERAPALKNWDVNMVKRFQLREGMFLQLRSEFYNIFNTPQYGTVSVSPFRPSQNTQTIPAPCRCSAAGVFANATVCRRRRPRHPMAGTPRVLRIGSAMADSLE